MISRRLRCAAALAAVILASCGGGSDSSSNAAAPPIGGGGNGGGTPTPSPTPTPAPRFGFAAPFAFDTAIGVEGTEFTGQDNFNQILRIGLIESRFLSAGRMARVSFAPQGANETIEFRYDNVVLTATGPAGSNPEFRFIERDVDKEGIVIGPLTPPGNLPSSGSAEVTVIDYRSARAARTFETAVGTAQRRVFAIIGNPATEFGRISRSKEYQSFGRFTGDLEMQNSFILSADYNTGIFGSPVVSRAGSDGQQDRLNLYIEGAHDITTNRLSGRVRNGQQGEVIGTFEGSLYGPNRNHVGMVFDIVLPQTGRRHIGWVFGSGRDRS